MMATAMAVVLMGQGENLKPIEWLVGEWDGKAKYGEQEMATKFVYTKALGGSFIQWRYQALAGGKVVFESTGFIGWDMEEKKLVDFGFGMDGTIGWGKAAPTDEKDAWVFDGKLSTSSPFKEVRKTIRKAGADRYTETVAGKKGEEWVPLLKAEYSRRK